MQQYHELPTLKAKYEKMFTEFMREVGHVEELIYDHQMQFTHFAASEQFRDFTASAKRETIERAFEVQKLLLGIHYAHHPNRTPEMYFEEKVKSDPCGYWRKPTHIAATPIT